MSQVLRCGGLKIETLYKNKLSQNILQQKTQNSNFLT